MGRCTGAGAVWGGKKKSTSRPEEGLETCLEFFSFFAEVPLGHGRPRLGFSDWELRAMPVRTVLAVRSFVFPPSCWLDKGSRRGKRKGRRARQGRMLWFWSGGGLVKASCLVIRRGGGKWRGRCDGDGDLSGPLFFTQGSWGSAAAELASLSIFHRK